MFKHLFPAALAFPIAAQAQAPPVTEPASAEAPPITVSGSVSLKPGLGPNATSVAPTGRYWDWSLGLDASCKNLSLGVAWIETDISDRDAAYLRPSFSKWPDGTGNIARSTVVVSLTAAF